MIVVKLMGGLGNQMFQYAAARSLASRLGSPLSADLNFLLDRTPRPNFTFRNYDLDIFGIQMAAATEEQVRPFLYKGRTRTERLYRKFFAWPRRIHYREPHFHFDHRFHNFQLPWKGGIYLEGYWQSPKYFRTIEVELRQTFSFPKTIQASSQQLYAQIQSTESVMINARRTDYLSDPLFKVCSMGYFRAAIDTLSNHLKQPHFFVFSDDIEWCRENFAPSDKFTIVGHEHAGPKFANYLHLMSACRHSIIPNSTFAWWAAWLNPNPNKIVLAPRRWFADPPMNPRDLIPDTWIQITD
jgi:hypothetical protein